MEDNDPVVFLIKEFGKCPDDMKSQFLEGLELGFKIALLSARNENGFSRELDKYLLDVSNVKFSLQRHFQILKTTKDIVVRDEMFTTSGRLFEVDFRTDYVNAMRMGYEITMKAFLSIIEFYPAKGRSDLFIGVYVSSFNALLNGLKFTLMEVKDTSISRGE